MAFIVGNFDKIGEFNEFCKIVLEDKPIVTTALEGAKTCAACMAIVDSATQLKTIERTIISNMQTRPLQGAGFYVKIGS